MNELQRGIKPQYLGQAATACNSLVAVLGHVGVHNAQY
jgi:hypothetical protein